jgi:dihydrofolate reductase
VSKLIEVTHVSLGGEVGSNDWAHPYLDEQHRDYATTTLGEAEALLLGQKTYKGLSVASQTMPSNAFVDKMNALPKYVATKSLEVLEWNAMPIRGDVAEAVASIKRQATDNIIKYGNGPLDAPLMEKGLIDEFHLLLTPIASGTGQHLFEAIEGAPALDLVTVERFRSGVVLLVYAPIRS